MRTLETGEKGKYDTMKLFGLNSLSAHPLTDENGVTYNLGPSIKTGLRYNLLRIPPPSPNSTTDELIKRGKIIASVPSRYTLTNLLLINPATHTK